MALKAPLVMLIAGEASGDALGAGLMRALRAAHPGVRFVGVGGAAMQREGLYSLFRIERLSVMGFAEVVPRLRDLIRLMDLTAEFALRLKPDVVVHIDSGDFNTRVARKIRKTNPAIALVKYVSSQVWGSRPWRAAKLKGVFDHIICLLPFEPRFYSQYGIPASFVGHPAIERQALFTGGGALRARLGVAEGTPLLAVLPGSRRFEVRYLMPVFREALRWLAQRGITPVSVLPAAPGVAALVRRQAAHWPGPIHIVEGEADRFAAFDAADLALAASGTVTTELALARVPMAVAYKVGWLTAFVWRRLITVRFATLVNILLDRAAVPEFIQENAKPEALGAALAGLMPGKPQGGLQKAALDEAVTMLQPPDDTPSRGAARIVAQTGGFAD